MGDDDEHDCEGGSGAEGFSETDQLILHPLDLDTRAQERLLLRKLDLRILPILCLLYLFACEFNAASFSL
jgi:hypothetical protein